MDKCTLGSNLTFLDMKPGGLKTRTKVTTMKTTPLTILNRNIINKYFTETSAESTHFTTLEAFYGRIPSGTCIYSVARERKAENPLILSHAVPLKWVEKNKINKHFV